MNNKTILIFNFFFDEILIFKLSLYIAFLIVIFLKNILIVKLF